MLAVCDHLTFRKANLQKGAQCLAENIGTFRLPPFLPTLRAGSLGCRSIPKGEPDEDEDLLITAISEFKEETGINVSGDFVPLGSIIQKGGKEVFAWAVKGDMPKDFVHECNVIDIEWPPHSGNYEEFPEIDKVEFFDVETAKKKIKSAQIQLIERLEKSLNT